MDQFAKPIFIGGTGRSGTSIMARLLASHPDICLPAHENKLIAEKYGLESLVNELSAGFEFRANHVTIERFIYWARVLRKRGFHRRVDRLHYGVRKMLNRAVGRGFTRETYCRLYPDTAFSLLSVGEGFGLVHYDRCLRDFLDRIIGHTDEDGIFDTEGMLKPFYTSATSDREVLLTHARDFLRDLYSTPMQAQSARFWCDDTPVNVIKTDFLTELYPDCTVLHMVRDPRDVLSSYVTQTWATGTASVTLENLFRFYHALAQAEDRNAGRNIVIMRLEDLIEDYETETARLFDRIGLSRDGFDFSDQLNAGSVGRWQKDLDPKIAREVEDKLGFVFERYGYT